MKTAALVLSMSVTLLVVGCNKDVADSGGADTRVAALEKQVAALQERDRDVRAKLRAFHSFGRSPLGDFFASSEFWQCTYDSAWSDCANRCSKNTADGYKACIADHPEGQDRVDCINKNSEAGSNCLKNCPVQMSPTSPPGCAGGGGGIT